jgi:hypothetical protein
MWGRGERSSAVRRGRKRLGCLDGIGRSGIERSCWG